MRIVPSHIDIGYNLLVSTNGDDLFDGIDIVPASVSAARAARVLPTVGTEDVRHLLHVAIPEMLVPTDDEERDFLPDVTVDWVVDVELPGSLHKSRILEAFDRSWFAANGYPELYGRAVADGHWTWVNAGDAPDQFDALACATTLLDDPRPGEYRPRARSELQALLVAIESRASRLGAQSVVARTSSARGAVDAKRLHHLWQECARWAHCVLAAPDDGHFDGHAVWDTMLCLGLRWGNMDQFHWDNPRRDIGGDELLSVWTTTSPGYFLPEEIAGGRMNPETLVFGFSIPRSPDPSGAFESLMRAVRYVQTRLGGELLDDELAPFDEAAESQRVRRVVDTLASRGMTPGLGSVLRMFD